MSLQLADPRSHALVLVDGAFVPPDDARTRVDVEDFVLEAATAAGARESHVVAEIPATQERDVDREVNLHITSVVAAGTPEADIRRGLAIVCSAGAVAISEANIVSLVRSVTAAHQKMAAQPRAGVLAKFAHWIRKLLSRSR